MTKLTDQQLIEKLETLLGITNESLQNDIFHTFTYEWTNGAISSLKIEGIQINDKKEFKSIVQELHSLQDLSLIDLNLEEISFLKSLTALTSLNLRGNKISDLSILSFLPQLKSLFLANNQFNDLNDLSSLAQLQLLDLSNNQLSNLSDLSSLYQLASLSLDDNQVSDLSGLSSLTQLESLHLSNNQVSDLNGLSFLTQLQELYLNNNQVSDLSGLSSLTQLQELYLNNNQVSDLSGLSSLTQLQELYLSNNQISDLSGLSSLTQLQELYLSNNQVSDLSGLSSLTQLESLHLNNNQVSDLSGSSSLTQLESLYLSNNQVSDLSGLSSLTQLESLHLSNNQVSDLSGLSSLTQLETLSLENNQVSDLRSLSSLTRLERLYLENNQVSDLRSLSSLIQLQRLYLDNNQVSDLSSLSSLTQLETLSLENNQVSDLSGLSALTQLETLSLENNQVSDLSSLSSLTQLESLYLDNNQISSLPEWIFGIEDLEYEGNPITDPPLEILQEDIETIKRYFKRKRTENFSSIKEAKLILVGDGAAGKTSLQIRLLDDGADLPEEKERTRGIEVYDWEFKEGFIAHIWDFGGQDVYYPVHRFFITEKALFVVLASTRNERHNFDYWIPTIHQFGGNSPVIIGQTCHDGNVVPWNDIGRFVAREEFNIIKTGDKLYYELNLKDDNQGLTTIKKVICDQLLQLPHCVREVPMAWIRVREAVREEAKDHPCISYERFTEICDKVGLSAHQLVEDYSDCCSFLHHIGSLIWYSKQFYLQEYVILDPKWMIRAVYRIIDDKEIQKRRGHIVHADFDRLWQEKEYRNRQGVLKQILEVFRVAFPKKHRSDEYIMPARLWTVPAERLIQDEPCLQLEYHYEFMPRGILNQLSAELSRYIVLDQEGNEEVWNDAVNFSTEDSRCQVYEDFSNKKRISIKAQGKGAKGLLTVIKLALDEINKSYRGVEPEIFVPCNCEECRQSPKPEKRPYHKLVRLLEKGRDKVSCDESGESILIDNLLFHVGLPSLVVSGAMKKDWTTIHLFLASSQELEAERREFEIFIARENKELMKRGIFLHLDVWEDFLDCMSDTRLQNEYNKKVVACDIFISLFYSKVGKYTEEEFDQAYGRFIKEQKPLIYTYFKEGLVVRNQTREDLKNMESVIAFKEKLEGLGHYPTSYRESSDLHLHFKRQLDKLEIIN